MTYTHLSHYHQFIAAFGERHSFQTFCDKGLDRSLVRQFHGTLKEHFAELTALNRRGAGVFFTVNQTNGLGRTTQHIKSVRSVFIDLDGAPLPDTFELQPHIIVNTSKGKYHCYWLVNDMPLPTFTLYQEALAKKYNSDPVVKDLPRVMRVAGFFHHKSAPYPIKIFKQKGLRSPYKMDEIREGLKLERPTRIVVDYKDYKPSTYQGKYTGTLRYGMGKGERHERLVKILLAIRFRGESMDYAMGEAMAFASSCNPPESVAEVQFQVRDIWSRYAPR